MSDDSPKPIDALSIDDTKETTEDEQNFRRKSWSKTVKRISLSDDLPKPIDALGIETKEKTEGESKKEAVTARNNWIVDLVDSESEQDSVVPDSDEEISDEQSDDEHSGNLFIDDEAEEAENYNSGDSMDSDDRREVKGIFL